MPDLILYFQKTDYIGFAEVIFCKGLNLPCYQCKQAVFGL